jgi:hypothetical protein
MPSLGGDQLITDLTLRTTLPTCVEPTMLHLAYNPSPLSLLTGVTCKMWRTDAEFS